MDYMLIVPANPLSAPGPDHPYQLTATNPVNDPCNESNKVQAAFVQEVIIDPATGSISIYNPLVVDQGTQPAVQPQPSFGVQIPGSLYLLVARIKNTCLYTYFSLRQAGYLCSTGGSLLDDGHSPTLY
jgi:hypothetical protein